MISRTLLSCIGLVHRGICIVRNNTPAVLSVAVRQASCFHVPSVLPTIRQTLRALIVVITLSTCVQRIVHQYYTLRYISFRNGDDLFRLQRLALIANPLVLNLKLSRKPRVMLRALKLC